MRKSARKQQQSQVNSVTSGNVTQHNSNIYNFCKGSDWFCC